MVMVSNGTGTHTTTTTGGSSGVAVPFNILNPYRVVVFIEYVGV